VSSLPGHHAIALVPSGGGRRVAGLAVRPVDGGDAWRLDADLVVDAAGRGSHAPAWLEALGYLRPPEETITIGVGYTTRLYRRRAGDLDGDVAALVHAQPPNGLRAGFAFPLEGDAWIVTLVGWHHDHAPADEPGFRAYARSLAAPDIADLIEHAEPLDDGAVYKFPTSVRRRFERLGRPPDGFLVTGDALCSFNPVYGQGMAAAALEADALDGVLRAARGRPEGLPLSFYRRVAKVVDTPWRLAAGADFAFPGTEGPKAPGTDAVNRYVGHVRRAAVYDAEVARVFTEVANLVRSPGALFAPAVLLRVLRASRAGRTGRGTTPNRRQIPAPGGVGAPLP
jgi:2-polyprenyl-6-methoxyphenol hydroxylase-like FAD-dependent oxidoreductase